MVDPFACDPAPIVFSSALPASLPKLKLDRPGRAAKVAGGLLRAEERIQLATMTGLG